jgi:3-oxoacyl-[acyl-carrier protein] reductase
MRRRVRLSASLPAQCPALSARTGAAILATKSLAVEYAPTIRCNAIAPAVGNTTMLLASSGGKQPTPEQLARLTNMLPMGRITEPVECVGAVLGL